MKRFFEKLFKRKPKVFPTAKETEKTDVKEKSAMETFYETSVNILASSIWDDD